MYVSPHRFLCQNLFFNCILFYVFWLCWVFIAAHGLPLVTASMGATLHCIARASHCDGFSCCGEQALGVRASVIVAHGLSSCGVGSSAHGLSCSAACGIFPDQGLNPCPLHWKADSQSLRHQGSPMLKS